MTVQARDIFPDGSIQFSAAQKNLWTPAQAGQPQELAEGRTTPCDQRVGHNRVTSQKWLGRSEWKFE